MVVALTESPAHRTPTDSAAWASVAAWRRVRGELPMTWTAMLPIAKPASAPGERPRRAGSAPLMPGYLRPVDADRRAQVAEARRRSRARRARVGRDVAVGVAGKARRVQSGQQQTGQVHDLAGCEVMNIDADPDAGNGARPNRSGEWCGLLRTRAPRRGRSRPCPRWSARPARARRPGSAGPWRACASRLPTARGRAHGATGRERPRTP